jgi:hypothetical protein
VTRRVGEVAYELEFPEGSKIRNVFHVSCLKKALGQHITTSTELPPLDEEGQLVLVPEEVLEVWEKKLRNRVIREYLVRWREFPAEYATWESEQILQHPNLQLLGDKQSRGGRTIMSPSE